MIKVFLFENDKLNTFCESDIKNAFGFGKSEIARLASIKNEKRFCESACTLAALGELLDKEYGGIRYNIIRDTNGKPYFEDSDLTFSLSHSDSVAVAAICDEKHTPIGVDIEKISDQKNASKLAERYFNSAEKSNFYKSERSPNAFFEIWTKKEAYAKMTGDGIASIISNPHENPERTAQIISYEFYNNNDVYSLSISYNSKNNSIEFYNNSSNFNIK